VIIWLVRALSSGKANHDTIIRSSPALISALVGHTDNYILSRRFAFAIQFAGLFLKKKYSLQVNTGLLASQRIDSVDVTSI
jgi:hypothetical protein